MKSYTFLLCSSMVFADTQKQQQFDNLIQKIVTGEHYFFSADDFAKTLAQLEQLLPANDPQRASMLDRQRCSLGFYHDPAAGIAFSETKLAQATLQHDYGAIYDYQTCRFYLFDMQGQTEQAKTSAILANEAAIKSENPLYIALSETELGNLASYRGDYADALTHYLRAYPMQQQLGYKPYISDLVLSIAAAYRRMGLFAEAIAYIEAAEAVFDSPNEQFRRAMVMHEKAYSYAELGQAEHERVKLQHSAQPLCILIIDLDHFKQINDTFGHDAGDTVLQQVSITMSGLLRQQDYVGRTGGEEFMIVLPDTLPEQAQAIAERIRIALSKLDLTTIAPALRISCSIGLTQTLASELLNSSIARADKALYRAKAEGRNRVVMQ